MPEGTRDRQASQSRSRSRSPVATGREVAEEEEEEGEKTQLDIMDLAQLQNIISGAIRQSISESSKAWKEDMKITMQEVVGENFIELDQKIDRVDSKVDAVQTDLLQRVQVHSRARPAQ